MTWYWMDQNKNEYYHNNARGIDRLSIRPIKLCDADLFVCLLHSLRGQLVKLKPILSSRLSTVSYAHTSFELNLPVQNTHSKCCSLHRFRFTEERKREREKERERERERLIFDPFSRSISFLRLNIHSRQSSGLNRRS